MNPNQPVVNSAADPNVATTQMRGQPTATHAAQGTYGVQGGSNWNQSATGAPGSQHHFRDGGVPPTGGVAGNDSMHMAGQPTATHAAQGTYGVQGGSNWNQSTAAPGTQHHFRDGGVPPTGGVGATGAGVGAGAGVGPGGVEQRVANEALSQMEVDAARANKLENVNQQARLNDAHANLQAAQAEYENATAGAQPHTVPKYV